MIRKRILIKGPKVHDVGYRLFLLDEAEARLIPHLSAKNIKNETEIVDVLLGGEKEQVESFTEFVKINFPEDAEVDSISVEDYEGDIRTIESFSRSFSVFQLSKIARTGVAMLNVQKDTNKAVKKISESQDQILNGQDSMLEKQDQTISVIKEESEKTRIAINSGFAEEIHQLRDEMLEIRHEIAEIKEKVGA